MKEREPEQLSYKQQNIITDGHPQRVTIILLFCADPDNAGAPIYHIPSQ